MKSLLLILGLFVVGTSASAQCPPIVVVGPPGVSLPGDRISFRVTGGASDLRYRWTVSDGTIINGQGTPTITVDADKTMSTGNVVAKVDVGGLPPSCSATSSGAAPVRGLEWESIDEWNGNMPSLEQRSRLDSFFADLANNPTNTGLVILRVPTKERRDVKNKRVRLIIDHARWRKFDLGRIWFSFETFFEPRIVVYRFYPGAEGRIPCDQCKIIKGGDL